MYTYDGLRMHTYNDRLRSGLAVDGDARRQAGGLLARSGRRVRSRDDDPVEDINHVTRHDARHDVGMICVVRDHVDDPVQPVNL